ncbi:MAG TPA: DUF1810 domain-containing protein [Flavitalea sp.]|nr:DUF1810 domain-containing protein [Flavitalea sp.]
MSEEINLQRFIDAQEANYERALSEINNGRKESHWMWYIFPQIQGLGFSSTSVVYAIRDIMEAEAFLKHPLLGNRLIGICNVLLKIRSSDALQIFGSPDNVKLKSSMTLFSSLNMNPVFDSVLDKFFQGKKDDQTLSILARQNKRRE